MNYSKDMVNGQAGREGTEIGARTACEESVMQAIGMEGMVMIMGPLHLSMERLA